MILKSITSKLIMNTLTVLCLLVSLSSFGQVDSLKRVLYNSPDGSKEKADAYNNLAYAFMNVSADSCMLYADSLQHYATRIKYPKRIVAAFYHKGIAYYLKGEFEEAINALKIALEKGDAVENKLDRLRNESGINNLLANIYIGQANYEAALGIYHNNLEVAEALNDTMDLAIAHDGIGNIFLKIFDYENAEKHLKQSIIYSKLINRYDFLTNTYNSLSIVASNTDTANQLSYLNQALQYANKSNNSYYLGAIYDNFADYYNMRNNKQKAIEYNQKSLKLSESIGNIYNYGRTCVSIGTWYSDLEQSDSALYYLEKGVKILEENQFSAEIGVAYLHLAQGLSRVNRYKEAYDYMMKSHQHIDSTFNTEIAQQIEDNNAKFEFERNQRQIAEQQLEIAQSQNTRNLIIFIGLALLIGIAAVYQWYLTQQRKKQQVAELALATQQAEAERLKELDLLKTNFFTNISHELRTPLTLILSPLADVMNGIKSTPIKHKLRIIENNGQKLLNLVNEIMDLSKLEAGKLEVNTATVQLSPLMKRLFSAFESLADLRKIKYHLNLQIEEQTSIRLDLEKFEKIINNLIGNAIKYNSSGGSVTVDIFEKDNQFEFQITDTGKGIAEEDLPYIFNRFYQSKTKSQDLQGGTGVGLALSKELAELLGGDLMVKSVLGKGSVFTLVLPLEKVENQLSDTLKVSDNLESSSFDIIAPFQPIFINGEKPKVLVVEDNPEMSKYLVQILSEQFQCTAATDGQEALKQLKLYPFDAIISDVMMPNMDGFEFREHINENAEWKQLPFLMLTARSLEADKIRGLQLGIDDYMTKPFSTNELNARLHNLITNKIERDEFLKTQTSEEATAKPLSADQQILQQAETIILKNLDNEKFKVPDLAKAIGYSSKQLGRIIKQLTGLSTVGFILEIRLQKARTLLEKRIFPTVLEVQYEVGISSTSYFTTKFTQRFGKNPKEFLSRN